MSKLEYEDLFRIVRSVVAEECQTPEEEINEELDVTSSIMEAGRWEEPEEGWIELVVALENRLEIEIPEEWIAEFFSESVTMKRFVDFLYGFYGNRW